MAVTPAMDCSDCPRTIEFVFVRNIVFGSVCSSGSGRECGKVFRVEDYK